MSSTARRKDATRIIKLTASPLKIFLRGHVLIAQFPGTKLAQRLGKLPVGVVGRVLARPPDIIAELARPAEPTELTDQCLQADEAVDSDLVAPPLCRGRSQDARLQPCLDGCARDSEQPGRHGHRHARQLASPVFEQDFGGFPDTLLVQPARGHIVQQRNVRDDLLSVLILACYGHLPPPSTEQYTAVFVHLWLVLLQMETD